MERTELIRALQRLQVETGSLVCLGYGYEHSCSAHGCAVIRQARETLVQQPTNAWIRCTDAVPDDPCEEVLAVVNGWVTDSIQLVNAVSLAVYSPDEGWMLEDYPEAEEIEVACWTRLPPLPEWVHV
ncbi:MAG: hypothetical protein NC311_08875 [Muribaculaceae bacterium]|nr:hypothetical protein [Muribaculaceae bacterium]